MLKAGLILTVDLVSSMSCHAVGMFQVQNTQFQKHISLSQDISSNLPAPTFFPFFPHFAVSFYPFNFNNLFIFSPSSYFVHISPFSLSAFKFFPPDDIG
jgi:ABC-type anion transport system duplicated permease subunit